MNVSKGFACIVSDHLATLRITDIVNTNICTNTNTYDTYKKLTTFSIQSICSCPDVQEREPITSGQGHWRPPAVGKGHALHNVHIALLPKKVTIPIWDKYVQMENMYVSITKCSVEMEDKKYKYHQKKSKYPKVVGSLSAEVLFHDVGARARNATVSQIPRQLNATTAPLGYWNALSKYKYKYKLICSRHLTKSYNERIQMAYIDVTFVEGDYDDKMRTGGCNYLVNRAECSGSDNHTADLSTGSVFYIR